MKKSLPTLRSPESRGAEAAPKPVPAVGKICKKMTVSEAIFHKFLGTLPYR
ncbi:hypothetical protein [Tatumella sp. JGM118]|uniref:Uncharacterized protein n=1 Tax=Tatumella terrea TaxID=419007 RepID=A0ABW1VYG9_9GAMM|nr:hypothetical protein [Tatumella sp. JGM118]MBS0909867.1 hypothetical protein [Tatumella sp. JGM118]